MKAILVLLLFFLFEVEKVYAQSVPGPFDVNSFSELSERRTRLNVLIPGIESRLAKLNLDRDTSIIQRDIKYIENNIKWSEGKIAGLRPEDTSKLNLEYWLEDGKQRYDGLLDELKSAKENVNLRTLMIKSLDSANNARSDVEYKINQLMIPRLSQQNFMFWASIAFLVLMCILLYTFFRVVSRDENVRKIIFGSDSGIQFVTLFSIVIAIILFGLTGVLEGKELSALLGSVAGYILGKVKFTNDKPPSRSATNDYKT
ncbi:hypothetical protein [Niabella drilacis]|uniref:Uncharacterized protein n=1 Tax=Niabella drilacis (strain DSM 25811 / CCM 8410 / CCUG 62505 / LMG 26954 / E90) TaxID=1285928 RepID=A0A1G6U9V3_NIADE|nr:hypothetical protein [Niabella drilacis]SDD37335.1 hypothetical protein SAMN04487894_108175 [Niabella drilacis]